MIAVGLALASSLALAGGADCPTGVPLATFTSRLEAAELAYTRLDNAAFDDALDSAAIELPCLVGELDPATIARWHALTGLSRFRHGRAADVAASFAAARAADPRWTLPAALVPAGHELRAVDAGAVSSETAPVPVPLDGTLLVDGHALVERPVARPTVVQLVAPPEAGRTGRVPVLSAYVLPGDPWPLYPAREPEPVVVPVLAAAPAPAPVAPEPAALAPAPVAPVPAARRSSPARWVALGASILSAGASATLYGLASASAAEFDGPLPATAGREDLEAMRGKTNGLVAGSVAAGTVAIGAGVVFVASGPR